jgi:hypothetical protein
VKSASEIVLIISQASKTKQKDKDTGGLGLRQSLLSDVTLDAFSGRYLHCRCKTEDISLSSL